MNIKYIQIQSFSESQKSSLRDIYETNFPLSEREPIEDIFSGIESEKYLCYAGHVADDQSTIVGIAIVEQVGDLPLYLLGYLAVDNKVQNQKIGSTLLKWIMDNFFSSSTSQTLIWEVEQTETDDPSDFRNRRIAFYERLGAKRIERSLCYRMPNFETDDAEGVPLWLFQYPLEKQPTKNETKTLIKAIYDYVYPGNPELFDKIIQELDQSQE